jgi:hypothetical protein
LRAEPAADAPARFSAFETPPREGLAVPVQVAFCALALPAPPRSHPGLPALRVGERLLSLEHLHNEIRVKAGAYGCGAGCWETEGVWLAHSYRDPNIRTTLAVFRGLAEFVRGAPWTQADIDRAIIGTAKEGERPIRPGAATGAALHRHLMGETVEFRERRHEATLRTTPEDAKRVLLEVLEPGLPRAAFCVAANRAQLEAANAQSPEAPLAIEEVMK